MRGGQRRLERFQAEKPDEINALADKDVMFAIGDFKLPFTAANFLLSFEIPNFYFHTTTAYALLRQRGVQLG